MAEYTYKYTYKEAFFDLINALDYQDNNEDMYVGDAFRTLYDAVDEVANKMRLDVMNCVIREGVE